MSPIAQLSQGFFFLLRGWKLILSHPSLLGWALIPFMIDVGLLLWGFTWGMNKVPEWAAGAISWLVSPDAGFWYSLAYYPLLALFWIVFVVALIYVTFAIATIVAAPFNSMLAERTLVIAGVIPEKPFQWKAWLVVTLKMLRVSLFKALLFAVFGVVILVMSFIPGLNVVSSYLAFLIMAFDSMDYSFEVREFNLGQRLAFFRQNLVPFSGMAGALGLTVILPGVTLLFLPAAVVGAASLMKELEPRLPGRSQ